MTQGSRVSRSVVIALVLALMIPAFAFANPEGREAVGRMIPSSSSVQWMPNAGQSKISLRVVGPDGATFQKEFSAGSAPAFRLTDLGGKFPDGAYSYELRVIPNISNSVKAELAAAREANDDAAIARIQKAAGIGAEVVQFGTLTVMNGAFVNSSAQEPIERAPKASSSGASTSAVHNPSTMDVVTADDAIIQGSLCVGLDCVNNESFGFDTIRLKENNTRINFTDTSTSAGFPTEDWELTANDSASGGANKFSITDITAGTVPFTVTGAAPTNSIFVASNGKVGFRNSSPGLDLHITTGDTPAIRQEQTNASGFTAQTWDIGANEANWFVRDVTGGSRLPLRIRPGATTSSVDISSDGDVGINTASPNGNTKLDVFDSTQVKARISLTGQEMFQASNTSTDGVALIVGVNRSNNRQLWIGDTSALTQNTTNRVIRILPNNGDISAITTDGTTSKDLLLQLAGGFVGIGTATPSSRLTVGGDVRVVSGSFIDDGVTLTAPDYVFENDYKLMSLPQLGDYLKAEKHLPNVPSAKDIKSNGLNVSQFQMRLLEKVEELTLYTLDQHEQIGTLKAQNEMLLNRLATLEKKMGEQKQ